MMKQRLFFGTLIAVILSFGSLFATTQINGLAVVVQFKDKKLDVTTAQINDMMNKASGFTLWGNNGSVSQYYSVQSNGNAVLNAKVLTVTLAKNAADYDNAPGYDGGVQLVVDVVAAINAQNPNGFTGLTKHPTEDRLWYFTLLCSKDGGGVAYGFDQGLTIKNDGVAMPIRHTALCPYGVGQTPGINVICHELGHHIFGWTDYYNIYSSGETSNLGHYCVMGSGGIHTSPMPLNPALRIQKGWIPTITDLTNSSTKTITLTSNNRSVVYKYANKYNAKEFFLIEAVAHGGYYLSIDGDGYVPDQGLTIWYVDMDGGIDKPTYTPQPKIKVVQADGVDEMHIPIDDAAHHHDHRGDSDDLFDNTYPTFNDKKYPIFKWKDGSETGMILSNISAPGATMTFQFTKRTYTITSTAGTGGTVSPKGIYAATKAENLTVNIVPEIGYAISDVKVAGSSKGAISSYKFSNITSSQTIAATFKTTTADVLPSPWKAIDLGVPSKAGVSGHRSGSFKIDSYGSDIWGGNDNFHFVYQPLSGNGEIIAHIASFNKPNDWAKSGVMIRESLTDNSSHIMAVKTGWEGIATQFRTTTGGGMDNTNDNRLNYINWVKVRRNGTTFTTYYSEDGVTWIQHDQRTITMATNVYIGLCASGASTSASNKTIFDNVKVTKGTLTREGDATLEETASSDENNSQNVVLSPNPFNEYTNIYLPASAGEATMTVTNINGVEVEKREVSGKVSFGNTYDAGVYIVAIQGEAINLKSKIIKQ